MARGEQHGNREAKKPKKPKPKEIAPVSALAAIQNKAREAAQAEKEVIKRNPVPKARRRPRRVNADIYLMFALPDGRVVMIAQRRCAQHLFQPATNAIQRQ